MFVNAADGRDLESKKTCLRVSICTNGVIVRVVGANLCEPVRIVGVGLHEKIVDGRGERLGKTRKPVYAFYRLGLTAFETRWL